MKYSTQLMKHKYSVFIIWRTVSKSAKSSERKDCVIVDIHELNKITVIDSYLMLLQSDITVSVFECRYILIFNAADFFHQWLVKIADWYKFIIVLHCEQE